MIIRAAWATYALHSVIDAETLGWRVTATEGGHRDIDRLARRRLFELDGDPGKSHLAARLAKHLRDKLREFLELFEGVGSVVLRALTVCTIEAHRLGAVLV
jgi:hypothetical protein